MVRSMDEHCSEGFDEQIYFISGRSIDKLRIRTIGNE